MNNAYNVDFEIKTNKSKKPLIVEIVGSSHFIGGDWDKEFNTRT